MGKELKNITVTVYELDRSDKLLISSEVNLFKIVKESLDPKFYYRIAY